LPFIVILSYCPRH